MGGLHGFDSGFGVLGFVVFFFFFLFDRCIKEEVDMPELGMDLIWMVAKFYLCSFFLFEYG